MKIRASWPVLMSLAKELGDARVSGDKEKIRQAQTAHDSYRDLCLRADEMSLDMTVGEVAKIFHG